MNAGQTITTIFEALALGAVILGIIYEHKLIELEERITNKWRVRK
jgi:hypothetical protein